MGIRSIRPGISSKRRDFLEDYWRHKYRALYRPLSGSQSTVIVCLGVHVSSAPLKQLTRTTISDLDLDTIAKGKYLMLRTLEPTYATVSIEMFVEDHTGDCIRLSAFNIMENFKENCQEIFPIGTIFILKEPLLVQVFHGSYFLRCDSPSDIVTLQEGDKYFYLTKDVVWINEPSSRPYPDSEYETQKTALEWKAIGNEMFNSKQFIHATRFYAKGVLETEKTKDRRLNKILLLNLSAAYLSSGYYESVISTVDKLLQIDPNCKKAQFRAGRANYELRKYAESKQWFTKLLQGFPDCEEAKTELQRCEDRLTEATQGSHSVYRMVLERLLKPRQPIDCADYIGPIRLVDIPGKGQRYVATKDLNPGTLLLVNKALKVAWKNSSAKGLECLEDDTPGSTGDLKTFNELTSAVANMVMKNPITFGPTISNLSAEANESQDHSTIHPVFCDPQLQEEPIVDIERICSTKLFRTCTGMFQYQSAIFEANRSVIIDNFGIGCFLLPMFGHRCVSNALHEIYNDVMFVRAVQPITEGEEIFIHRFNPDIPYEKRMTESESRGFRCDCRLCFFDENEPKNFRLRREALIVTFNNQIMKVVHQRWHVNIFQDLKKLIANMKSTYRKSKRKELQIDLIDVYCKFGMLYRKRGLHEQAADSFLNAIRAFGFEPGELLASYEETNAVTVTKSQFLSWKIMLPLEMLVLSYFDSGKVVKAKSWLQVMMAFDKILAGGDMNVFKQKFVHLKTFCDLLYKLTKGHF